MRIHVLILLSVFVVKLLLTLFLCRKISRLLDCVDSLNTDMAADENQVPLLVYWNTLNVSWASGRGEKAYPTEKELHAGQLEIC